MISSTDMLNIIDTLEQEVLLQAGDTQKSKKQKKETGLLNNGFVKTGNKYKRNGITVEIPSNDEIILY